MDKPEAEAPDHITPELTTPARKKIDPLSLMGFGFAILGMISGIFFHLLQMAIYSMPYDNLVEVAKYMSVGWLLYSLVFGFICLGFGLASALENKNHILSYTSFNQ